MPTKAINLRIDTKLLEYLQKRADKEHRTLSNMIISILLTEKECDENDALWDIVAKMPSVTPRRHWISIKDRLPEDGTWNLFTDGKSISVERYKYDAIDHFFPEGRWFTVEDVVAWMPLPEPYGAEMDGENE